jgi:inosine-uridine nucleoside N-ribohydrolase
MTDGFLAGEFIERLRGAGIVRAPPTSRHRESGDQRDLHLTTTFHSVVTILFDGKWIVTRFLALLSLAICANAATPVIIDTDMGSDDVMAIALLLSHREIPVEAITVVNGLAHVPAGAANARRLLQASGHNSIPVFEGREAPLQRTADFPREWRNGSDLPLTRDSPAAPPANQERAETWLARRLKDAAHPVRILALGPLTNLALALAGANPKAVEEIVIMGGAFRVPGNLGDGGAFKTTNTTAEWNLFVDPEAAARVLRAGVPIRVVPLDATSRVKLDSAFLKRYQSEAKGPLAALVVKVLNGESEMITQGLFYAWDPLAAGALLDPSVATWKPAHISIRQSGDQSGRSVIEPGTPNATVAIDADRTKFETLFLNAFTNHVASSLGRAVGL